MVLHRKRRLLLGLGLTVTLGLVVVLPPASAAAVSTLTGENFVSSAGQGDPGGCARASTFNASGAATGPYAGTFTEAGSFNGAPSVSATFSITSGSTTVTGSKSPPSGPPRPPWSFTCSSSGFAQAVVGGGEPYTATIHTPDGNFHDEGVTSVTVRITASGAVTLTESFTSSLTAPVLIVPTTKRQCKRGGWRDYPQFKNQGRCVRFVVTGKPPPRSAQRTSTPGQSKAPGQGNRSKAPK
jgi:hypothetical protein